MQVANPRHRSWIIIYSVFPERCATQKQGAHGLCRPFGPAGLERRTS